ncbi:MAG: SCO family protein [Alcanivorax sp.]|nr:SCO family protein [Alcanivorax sp.]
MIRWATMLLILGLAVLVGCQQNPAHFHGKNITGVMPDLAFTLTGENNQTVTAQDMQGKAVLLFFGYTHCPDYCPTTLTAIAQALKSLPENQRDQVRVLFVSVDPRRDTPALLKQYTHYFGKQIHGLTGNKAQLDAITKRYRTAYGYGKPDAHGHYSVSHGLAIYGFDKQGRVHLLMRNDEPPQQMAEDIATLVAL